MLTCDLEKGSKITADDLVAKLQPEEFLPLEINKFIGKSLARDLQQGDYIHFEDISDNGSRIEQFNISKHWGVVGRLNDFQEFLTWRPKLDRNPLNLEGFGQFQYQRPEPERSRI